MVYIVNKKLVSKCQLSKRSPIFTISIQILPYIVHILSWTIFEINVLLERMKLSRTFKIVMRSLMFKFNNFPWAVVSQYRSKVCLTLVTALKLWFRLFDPIVNRKNASRVPSSRAICSLSVLCAPGRFCGLARDSLPVALMMNQ